MPLDATIQDIERFANKFTASGGCWEWFAASNQDGYGCFRFKGKTYSAHSFIYQVLKGILAENLVVDHSCNNPKCVNPEHLKAMTQRENILKSTGIAAIRARQTVCKYGHEFSTPKWLKNSTSRRYCNTCHKLRERKRRERLQNGTA